jgi:2-iminobutanoate/2-iminopropanoate deaminase
MTPADSTERRGRAAIAAPDAPAAIGPYSHAIAYGGALYCSGALPLDPSSGAMADESPATETRQCLANLAAVCRAAGTDLSKALRMTIYTTRLDAFEEINEAYAGFFPELPPARVAIGVAALPKGAAVEIDAIVAAE